MEACIKIYLDFVAFLANNLDTMFYSFIFSHFKFVLFDGITVSHMKKITSIQKRALRIMVNDTGATYRELRERSQRPLLYVENIFKIYYGITPNNLNCFDQRKKTCLIHEILTC